MNFSIGCDILSRNTGAPMSQSKKAKSPGRPKKHTMATKKCSVTKLKAGPQVKFASDERFDDAHRKSMRKNAKILKALADK